MRVAIVGSRDYPHMDQVRALVDRMAFVTTVVSGGARGVDREAVNRARSRGLETQVFHADWTRLGKRAGYVRNEQMIQTVDYVVAFWDERSPGTRHAMDIAVLLGKDVRWYGADGQPRGAWEGTT